MKSRITIIYVLNFLHPVILRIAVNLVKEQMCATMRIVIIGQVNQAILVEP